MPGATTASQASLIIRSAPAIRTATSNTVASGAGFTITFPTGTAAGDFVILAVSNAGTTNPATPAGWSLLTGSPSSSGTGQALSVYYAQWSAGLTTSFTNVASAAAWVCQAYDTAGTTVIPDTSAFTTNATNNTTMPTGQPTTSAAAGQFEVLVYSWGSNNTITPAAGSTIERTQANGTSISVAIGHNNTQSLPANTQDGAFSQTLSGNTNRKSGAGINLLQGFAMAATSQATSTQPSRSGPTARATLSDTASLSSGRPTVAPRAALSSSASLTATGTATVTATRGRVSWVELELPQPALGITANLVATANLTATGTPFGNNASLSASATLTATPATIFTTSLTGTVGREGDSITITWSGVTSPTVTDLVTVTTPDWDDPGGSFNFLQNSWFYTSSGTQTPGATPSSSGSYTTTLSSPFHDQPNYWPKTAQAKIYRGTTPPAFVSATFTVAAASVNKLADPFGETSLAPQWEQATSTGQMLWGSSPWDSAYTVSVGGGVLTMTPPASHAAGQNGILSYSCYDLTGGAVYVKVPSVTTPATSGMDTALVLGVDKNNCIFLSQSGNTFFFAILTGGSGTTFVSGGYTQSVETWWRIRESGGTVYGDYSSDGITWNNAGSGAVSWAMTSLSVQLNIAGESTTPSSVTSATFQYLNTVVASASLSARASLSATRLTTTALLSASASLTALVPQSINTLSDPFNGTSVGSQWTQISNTSQCWNGESFSSAYVVSEGSGVLSVTPAGGTAANTGGGIFSTRLYDLTGALVDVQVPQVAATNVDMESYLFVGIDANNLIGIGVSGNSTPPVAFNFVILTGGSATTLIGRTYVPANMLWWRIRESGGTAYGEYSADGITWTETAHGAVSWNMHAVQAHLEVACFQTVPSTPTPASTQFDNLNTVVASASLSATGSLTAARLVPGASLSATATMRAFAGPVFVRDTFTGADGTLLNNHLPDIGGAWADQNNIATLSSNRLTWPAFAGTTVVNGANAPSANYTVSMDVVYNGSNDGTQPSVLARVTSNYASFYMLNFDLNSGFLELNSDLNGVVTLLASAPLPTAAGTYHLALTVNGSNLWGSINGVPMVSAVDTNLPAAGQAGMWLQYGTGNVVVDNFNATTVMDAAAVCSATTSIATTQAVTAAGGLILLRLASDSFDRANANPISGNWATMPTCAPLQIISNTVAATSGGNDNESYYTGVWPNDQYATVRISAVGTDPLDFGPAVRMSSSSKTFYMVTHYDSSLHMVKCLSGTFIGIGTDAAIPWNVGDILTLVAIGTSISFYRNGVLEDFAIDADIASGNPGINMFEAQLRLDDFQAGSAFNSAVVAGATGSLTGGTGRVVAASDTASLSTAVAVRATAALNSTTSITTAQAVRAGATASDSATLTATASGTVVGSATCSATGVLYTVFVPLGFDTFNRPNASVIGGTWTDDNGSNPFQISNQAVTPTNLVTNGDNVAEYTGLTGAPWPADTWSRATLTATGGTAADDCGPGVTVRHNGAGNLYRLTAQHAATNNISIFKKVSSVSTPLTRYSQSWTDGDTFELRVQGSTLTALLNGVVLGTLTDTSLTSASNPGITHSTGSSITAASIDNWVGGAIRPAPAVSASAALAASGSLTARCAATGRATLSASATLPNGIIRVVNASNAIVATTTSSSVTSAPAWTSTSGNLLVAVAGSWAATNVGATPFSDGTNTWSHTKSANIGPGPVFADVAYAANITGIASEAVTFSINAAQFPSVALIEVSGCTTLAPNDIPVSYATGGAVATLTTPLIVPQAGVHLLVVVGTGDGGNFNQALSNAGTGAVTWTVIQNDNTSGEPLLLAYAVVTANGINSYGATYTPTQTPDGVVAGIAAFRAVGVPSAPTVAASAAIGATASLTAADRVAATVATSATASVATTQGVAPWGGKYPVARDTFNRVNSTGLGSNWTTVPGQVAFNVSGAQAVPSDLVSTDSTQLWNAFPFSSYPNQYSRAQLFVTGASGGDQGPAVIVRADPNSQTFYRLVANHAASGNVTIEKEISSTLSTVVSGTASWSDGDTWELDVYGSTLTALLNGTPVLTGSDTSITANAPGISFSTTATSASIDNFESGVITNGVVLSASTSLTASTSTTTTGSATCSATANLSTTQRVACTTTTSATGTTSTAQAVAARASPSASASLAFVAAVSGSASLSTLTLLRSPALYFFDTFTGPDNSLLSNHSPDVGASWSDSRLGIILNNQLTTEPSFNFADGVALPQPPVADYKVSATLIASINSNAVVAQVTARDQGTTFPHNSYVAGWDNNANGSNVGGWAIALRASNAISNLVVAPASPSFNPGESRFVQFTVSGPTLVLTVDGVEVLRTTDTTYTSGYAGVILSPVAATWLSIDNYTVTPAVGETVAATAALVATTSVSTKQAVATASANPLFLQDSFTGADATPLTSHAPDIGGVWAGESADMQLLGNQLTMPDGSGYKTYWNLAAPPSADYAVQATLTLRTTNLGNGLGVMGRNPGTAPPGGEYGYYWSYYANANIWRLYLNSSSTSFVVLGTYSETVTSGQTRTMMLRMTGSLIEGLVDGIVRVSATDSHVTDAGYAGVWGEFGATGPGSVTLDNYQAGVLPFPSSASVSLGDTATMFALAGNTSVASTSAAGSLASSAAVAARASPSATASLSLVAAVPRSATASDTTSLTSTATVAASAALAATTTLTPAVAVAASATASASATLAASSTQATVGSATCSSSGTLTSAVAVAASVAASVAATISTVSAVATSAALSSTTSVTTTRAVAATASLTASTSLTAVGLVSVAVTLSSTTSVTTAQAVRATATASDTAAIFALSAGNSLATTSATGSLTAADAVAASATASDTASISTVAALSRSATASDTTSLTSSAAVAATAALGATTVLAAVAAVVGTATASSNTSLLSTVAVAATATASDTASLTAVASAATSASASLSASATLQAVGGPAASATVTAATSLSATDLVSTAPTLSSTTSVSSTQAVAASGTASSTVSLLSLSAGNSLATAAATTSLAATSAVSASATASATSSATTVAAVPRDATASDATALAATATVAASVSLMAATSLVATAAVASAATASASTSLVATGVLATLGSAAATATTSITLAVAVAAVATAADTTALVAFGLAAGTAIAATTATSSATATAAVAVTVAASDTTSLTATGAAAASATLSASTSLQTTNAVATAATATATAAQAISAIGAATAFLAAATSLQATAIQTLFATAALSSSVSLTTVAAVQRSSTCSSATAVQALGGPTAQATASATVSLVNTHLLSTVAAATTSATVTSATAQTVAAAATTHADAEAENVTIFRGDATASATATMAMVAVSGSSVVQSASGVLATAQAVATSPQLASDVQIATVSVTYGDATCAASGAIATVSGGTARATAASSTSATATGGPTARSLCIGRVTLATHHELAVTATCHVIALIRTRTAVADGATAHAETLLLVTIVSKLDAETLLLAEGTTTAWISAVTIGSEAILLVSGTVLRTPWRGGLVATTGGAASVGASTLSASTTATTGGATSVRANSGGNTAVAVPGHPTSSG